MANKIAIFGGSFNPIHLGHVEVASRAMVECDLSKIVFLPNAVPPHKNIGELVDATHRFNMVKLAIADYPEFEVSDYEMKKNTPSYTIDTMRHMRSFYNAELFFIIGADSLYTLHLWKSYRDLISECSFIVADRNCDQGSDIKKAADKIISMGGNIKILSMPKFDVTSTSIRDELLRGNESVAFLPQVVREYIQENNLYKTNPEDKR